MILVIIDNVSNPVSSITKPNFPTELCEKIDKLDVQTEATTDLKNRLLYDNLVTIGARYHIKCKMAIHNDSRTLSANESGHPKNEKTTLILQRIFEYIDKGEDCQYTSEDFEKLLSEGENLPMVKTIAKKLKEKYGPENVSVLSRKGGKTYFCLNEALYDQAKVNEEIKNEPDEKKRRIKSSKTY